MANVLVRRGVDARVDEDEIILAAYDDEDEEDLDDDWEDDEDDWDDEDEDDWDDEDDEWDDEEWEDLEEEDDDSLRGGFEDE